MQSVVAKLSPTAKQAMYAASKKGLIIRGRWTDGNGGGCAFNMAGREHSQSINDTLAAAHLFGMAEHDVSNFISTWDGLTCDDETANRYLIEALETVGTHTPINAGRGRRIIRGYAYKSEATKFAEQLESGELTVDMIPGCEAVGELLSSCSA
jgi:hypothetical protein